MIPFFNSEESQEALARTGETSSAKKVKEADEAAERLLQGATSCALLLPYLGVCFGFFGLGIIWAI